MINLINFIIKKIDHDNLKIYVSFGQLKILPTFSLYILKKNSNIRKVEVTFKLKSGSYLTPHFFFFFLWVMTFTTLV